MKQHLALLITLGLGLLASTADAQNIYQVEMIVFERVGSAFSGPHSNNQSLRYPDHWQKLFNAEEEASRYPAPTSDEASDGFLKTLEDEAAERRSGENNIDAELATPATLPFYAFLPDEQHSLKNSRAALDRQNQFRVLFHEAWRQPIQDFEKSPALLIHGGRAYGDYFELQGYLYLGLSRHLQVQAHLWLAEFSPDHGQILEHWPQLPKEPQGLASSSATTWQSDGTDGINRGFNSGLDSPYRAQSITASNQKQRVRIGELHYLDHPKLGVLLQVTPVAN